MAKIVFSSSQIELMQNEDIILQKHQILKNIEQMLWKIGGAIKSDERFAQISFPENMDYKSGKLSRGENLDSLPWRILDFPRLFSNEEIIAFRFLFWWGKTFEFTFLTNNSTYIDRLKTQFQSLKTSTTGEDYHLYTGQSPLKMSESDDPLVFKKLTGIKAEDINEGAIRISIFLSLSEWESLPTKGKDFFYQLWALIEH